MSEIYFIQFVAFLPVKAGRSNADMQHEVNVPGHFPTTCCWGEHN